MSKCAGCGERKGRGYEFCPQCTLERLERVAALEGAERYGYVQFTCLGCGSKIGGSIRTTLNRERDIP